MPEIIRIIGEGAKLSIKPLSFLGETFHTYINATSRGGATFDRVRKCQVASVGKIHDLIRELSAAGFKVEVDETLGQHFEEQKRKAAIEREKAKELHDRALARMEEIKTRLRPSGLAPYQYQEDGIRWLSHRKSALLCDEMGLGKTLQALLAAGDGAPMLVVAPSAVKGVWARETRRWRPDLGWPRVLEGRRSFRWPLPGDITITNYDILPELESDDPEGTPDHRKRYRLPEWVGQPKPGTVLVYDECAALKNPRAKRTRAARLVSERIRASGGFVWGLTGTPLLNRKDELWYVLHVLGLGKEAFGDKRHFDRGWTPDGEPRPEIAMQLRTVSLMRRREDVLPDLPTKTYQRIKVPIDKDTARACDALVASMTAAGVDINKVSSIAEIVAGTRDKRLTIGEISRVRAALAQAKTGELVKVIQELEEEGKPVVVFSAYLGPVEVLAKRPGWLRITGAEVGAERTRIVEKFGTGAYKGVACTIRAAGVGLDGLQKGSHNVVFCDRDWTPGWNLQAEDRVCRHGQEKGVSVTILVGDHILDTRLDELLDIKTEVIEGSVNASARSTVEDQFAADVAIVHPDPVTVRSRAEIDNERAKALKTSLTPMPRLFALLKKMEANGMARPAIRVPGLELHVSGERSKYRGQAQCTNGLPYGDPGNRWFGRLDAEGFHRSSACEDQVLEQLKAWEANTELAATLITG